MKHKLILLDNGHGGIINGEYQTAGKRSPIWSDGSVLYEGVFNRLVVNGISKKLDKLGVNNLMVVPENKDISLSERVRRINKYNNAYNCVCISIHANAGGGRGWEAYTSVGETKADLYASILYTEFKKYFPNTKARTDYTDGDIDKESQFYILRKTLMPTILTENFFMDNEDECKNILMNDAGINIIVDFHVSAILEILINM